MVRQQGQHIWRQGFGAGEGSRARAARLSVRGLQGVAVEFEGSQHAPPPRLSLRGPLRCADRLVGGRAATRAAAVRCGRWRKGQPDSERATAGARGAMSGDGCGA